MSLEIITHLVTFRCIPFALPSSIMTLIPLATEATGPPIVNYVVHVVNKKFAFQR